MGNTDIVNAEAVTHFRFFYRALARVMKPGRVACVHVNQIPRMKRSGEVGLCDFRGLNIRLGERAGLVYEYDWLSRRNPQAQALRTRSRELQFAGLESDRAKSRGALGDYIIKFRAPGENAIRIHDFEDVLDDNEEKIGERQIHPTQVTRNQWIELAEAAWTNIKETDTLNKRDGLLGDRDAKGENDTRHICPMSLSMVDPLVRLFSNPGERVFDPFMGIGTTGVVALKLGRQAYGCELKPEYQVACRENLRRMEAKMIAEKQNSLFGDEDSVEVSEGIQ